MNNNIQEDYCSFEVSKLLQNVGFDAKVTSNYNQIRELLGDVNGDISWIIKRPTHSLAIKWIRDNFGIWISVDFMTRLHPYNSGYFSHLRGIDLKINDDNFIPINDTVFSGYEVFNSPEEAAEAALLYTLKNLI